MKRISGLGALLGALSVGLSTKSPHRGSWGYDAKGWRTNQGESVKRHRSGSKMARMAAEKRIGLKGQ